MKIKTFLLIFLVCILVLDDVLAEDCACKAIRIKKAMKKIKPVIKTIRKLRRIRLKKKLQCYRNPTIRSLIEPKEDALFSIPKEEPDSAVLKPIHTKPRSCPYSSDACIRNCRSLGMRGKCQETNCKCD